MNEFERKKKKEETLVTTREFYYNILLCKVIKFFQFIFPLLLKLK